MCHVDQHSHPKYRLYSCKPMLLQALSFAPSKGAQPRQPTDNNPIIKIASIGYDDLKIWDLDSGKCTFNLPFHREISCIKILSNERIIICFNGGKITMLRSEFKFSNYIADAIFEGHTKSITKLLILSNNPNLNFKTRILFTASLMRLIGTSPFFTASSSRS